jgi:glycosyltransferase involved in cell wall biosynthesis
MSPRVAYVVRSWPRLSQTFIVNEVLGLERLGADLVVFSMVRPDEPLAAAQVSEVRAPVRYLDAALARPRSVRVREHASALVASPGRYLRTLVGLARGTHLTAGYSTASRWQCFTHAVHLATCVRTAHDEGAPIERIHAHFAHDPALVALLAHRLTGVPFSLTAHARDLYGIPARTLAARTDPAVAVVTCCRANADYLRETVGASPLLVHHGVDLERYRPAARAPAGEVPEILSVGRLVEKKGFADLLAACAQVRDEGLSLRCTIYGDGPMRDELLTLRDRLGLAGTVTLAGACPPGELLAAFQTADVFALTPVVTANGDRDGVPNVLVEAMACGVPVVSTAVGGVPELVAHGENGLLAPAHDPATVARHLAALLRDPAQRVRLGTNGRSTVEARFDARVAACRLASLFGAVGKEASCASLP